MSDTVEETGADTAADTATEAGAASRPALRIVRGEPNAEELAALAAVVAAAPDAAEPAEAAPVRGRWNDPAHSHRRPLHPGVGGWRASIRLP